MSLCRTWRQDTGKTDTILEQTGLRYDAGDWFAEILGDSWKSYDVVKRIKVSQEEWQEVLQPHLVPRLPYQCFAVEEFQYRQTPPALSRQTSPQGQLHTQVQASPQTQAQTFCTGGWIVEESHQPLTQVQQEVARKEQEQPQKQMQQTQPEQPKPLHRRNTRPMISGRLSSNQSSHGIQQLEYPKKQARHSQPNKQVQHSQHSLIQGTPIDQWTSLQSHLSLPPQHQAQASSFEGQKGKQRNSPPQPRRLPRQSLLKRPTSSHVQSVQQLSSVCQIQD
jgi:hypothetical protein